MAKEVTLNVKVQDEQFQQFIKSFNEFSENIKKLTDQFKQVGKTVDETTAKTRSLGEMLKGLLDHSKSLIEPVKKVTMHFTKWTALIGGLTMMLGTGAGIFGIDRLAQSIMQKRRQALGLGTDYGRTQAFLTAAGGTMSAPGDFLSNIVGGQQGNRDLRRALTLTGVPNILTMDPTDAADEIIKRIPQMWKEAPPGQEQQYFQRHGIGQGGVMSFEDARRFRDPDIARRTVERDKELRANAMSDKVAGQWADLAIEAEIFKTRLQTSLGTAFTGIASSLTQVSKGFSDLLDAFLNLPGVKDALAMIKDKLDEFATYLRGDDVQEKLKEWSDQLEKIDWKGLGDSISAFMGALSNVIGVLLRVKSTADDPSGMSSFATQFRNYLSSGKFWEDLKNAPGLGSLPGAIQIPDKSGASPSQTPPPVPPPGRQGAITGGSQFASNQFNNSLVNNSRLAFMGGSRSSTTQLTAAGGASPQWSSAVASAAPPPGGGGWSALLAAYQGGQDAGVSPSRARGLDVDNWQMNRVSQLVVHDLPGSNIHLTAARMAG